MRNPKAERVLNKIRNLPTPYDVTFAGVTVRVDKNVYPTSELAELMVACMDDLRFKIKPGHRVLDYGTGTGFLSIQAAKRGAKVVAIDINPASITCAQANVERHNLTHNINLRQGDSFEPVKSAEQFDFIYAGMPWDNAEPSDPLEMAMYDKDFHMRRTLFEKAAHHLKPGGCIFITYAEGPSQRHPLEAFAPNFRFEKVQERLIKDEPHFVMKASLLF